jgi:hypothetical protein
MKFISFLLLILIISFVGAIIAYEKGDNFPEVWASIFWSLLLVSAVMAMIFNFTT